MTHGPQTCFETSAAPHNLSLAPRVRRSPPVPSFCPCHRFVYFWGTSRFLLRGLSPKRAAILLPIESASLPVALDPDLLKPSARPSKALRPLGDKDANCFCPKAHLTPIPCGSVPSKTNGIVGFPFHAPKNCLSVEVQGFFCPLCQA